MTAEFQYIAEKIRAAQFPEEIFGSFPNTQSVTEQLTEVKHAYRHLAMMIHPDKCAREDLDAANELSAILNIKFTEAQQRIDAHVYGTEQLHQDSSQETEAAFLLKTKKHEFQLSERIAEGDLSVVYGGYCIDDHGIGNVAVKVIQDPDDNDLLLNEVSILKEFQAHPGKQNQHLPVLLDQFKTSDSQLGVVLQRFEKSYDLYAVREHPRYKVGVPEKHVVWILTRVLSAIGYAHHLGITHNNIDPSHIMVCPQNHNAFLLDWSYATHHISGQPAAFKFHNEDFSPPEVQDRKPPMPSSDLYAIGKCMQYLLGGDLQRNTFPPSTDPRFVRFLQFFTRSSQYQRAQDAWEMFNEFEKLKIEIWGPKKFLVFEW